MPLAKRMRSPHLGRCGALLLLLSGLLSTISLAQASAPQAAPLAEAPRPLPMLYLVAQGERSKIAELYLRALCDLLAKDTLTRARYQRIVLLRTQGDGLDSLQQRLRERTPGIASEDSTFLGQFKNLIARSELSDCTESTNDFGPERPSESSNDTGRIELLALDALGAVAGKKDEHLRAFRAEQDPSSPDRLGRVTAPQFRESSDIPAVARWLGLEVLGLDAGAVLQARLELTPETPRSCAQVRPPDQCISIHGVATLSLELRDTPWISARDVQATFQARCDPANQEGLENLLKTRRQQLQTGAEPSLASSQDVPGGRRLSMKLVWAARGACRFEAVLGHGPQYRRTLATEGQLEIHALPVLVKVFKASVANPWSIRSTSHIKMSVEQHKLGPWMKLGTSVIPGLEPLEELRVVSGEETLQLGEQIRDAILGLQLSSEVPEVVPLLKKGTRLLLASAHDGLGYAFLRDPSSVCKDLGQRLKKAAERVSGMPAEYVPEWTRTCRDKLEKIELELALKLRASPLPMLRLAPVPEEATMARRAILNIRGKQAVELSAREFQFSKRIDRAFRPLEKYLLSGKDASGELSAPLRLDVFSEPGFPDLEFSFFASAVTQSLQLRGSGLGLGLNLGAPVLDRLLLLELVTDVSVIPVGLDEDAFPALVGFSGMISIDFVRAFVTSMALIAGRPLYVWRSEPAGLIGIGYDVFRRDTFFSFGLTNNDFGIRIRLSRAMLQLNVLFPL